MLGVIDVGIIPRPSNIAAYYHKFFPSSGVMRRPQLLPHHPLARAVLDAGRADVQHTPLSYRSLIASSTAGRTLSRSFSPCIRLIALESMGWLEFNVSSHNF